MAGVARNRIYCAYYPVGAHHCGDGYKFIVAGSTQMTEDGRVAVLLEPAEQELMLKEMRFFVEGLQMISDALSKDDMEGVANAPRAMETVKAQDVPLAMIGKLPLEFKTLAFGVHGGFDTIAADAETVGMPKHTLGQLSEILQKCVACHSGYRLEAAAIE